MLFEIQRTVVRTRHFVSIFVVLSATSVTLFVRDDNPRVRLAFKIMVLMAGFPILYTGLALVLPTGGFPHKSLGSWMLNITFNK